MNYLTLVNKEHKIDLGYSPMDLMIVDDNANDFHELI